VLAPTSPAIRPVFETVRHKSHLLYLPSHNLTPVRGTSLPLGSYYLKMTSRSAPNNAARASAIEPKAALYRPGLRSAAIFTRRRFATLLVIAGWWTFVSFLFVPQTYIIAQGRPSPYTAFEALAANLHIFWSWVPLTPILLTLGTHLPLEKPRIVRNLLLLCLFAPATTFAHLLIVSTSNNLLLIKIWSRAAPASPAKFAAGLAATDIVIFWGVIGAGQAFNYFRKYKDREASLAQSQLQLMKMQLQPHFLFNTLNAISELVYDNPAAADRSITQLSDLLRLSLQSGKAQEVPLHEELEFLDRYINIQRTLLQERLRVRLNIEAEARGAMVPNMILQPLVENAIRHGIGPRSSGGNIEVNARTNGDFLTLEVADDGIGYDIATGGGLRSGLGLANTRERLRHLHGASHRFELANSPSGGLRVRMSFPFRLSSLDGSK
jgi:two-component system, LytTR family, sensor kinase